MPGATVCGSCRRALNEVPAATEATEPYVPVAEIYPPRASGRTARQQAEAHSPTVRRTNRYIEGEWKQTQENVRQRRLSWQAMKASFQENLRWWSDGTNLRAVASHNIAPLLSCIPGLGQLIQKRYATAGVLFLLFVPLVSVVVNILIRDWNVTVNGLFVLAAPMVALPYALLLNGVIFAFCILVWFSVWDAARHSYPALNTQDYLRDRFRNLRLAYGSAVYAALVLALFFWWLNAWRN